MIGDAGWPAVPHSIAFDPGRRTYLRETLNTLTRTLALDIADRIEKRTVVEETHTTVEHVLRAYLGKRAGGLSFEGMVRAAADDGVLIWRSVCQVSSVECPLGAVVWGLVRGVARVGRRRAKFSTSVSLICGGWLPQVPGCVAG